MAGNNGLKGSIGHDKINGGPCNNTIDGGGGNDWYYAGGSDDTATHCEMSAPFD
ncbi:MAG TPA: hypothetical protein VF016_10300 [Nitrososphaera sp.]